MIDQDKARIWPEDDHKIPCVNPQCDAYIYLICTSSAADDSTWPPTGNWLLGGLELMGETGPIKPIMGQYPCDKCGTMNVFRFSD